MRIKSFSYSDAHYELQPVDLQAINLIVGNNATGKTRLLMGLNFLTKSIITDRQKNGPFNLICSTEFITDDNQTLEYMVMAKSGSIGRELLVLNGKRIIERNPLSCKIYSFEKEKYEYFNPPKDKLVIQIRRDIKEYPHIESLVEWAENSYGFRFGNVFQGWENFFMLDDLPNIAEMYNSIDTLNQKKIIEFLNEIGFKITQITAQVRNGQSLIYIHEMGLNKPITLIEISQGLLRTIYVLIFIQYLISKGKTTTIFIDDLGEGLDYKRAIELGKRLYSLCKENNIQLVATSNDSFLMDTIDTDYWNVLTREGKIVKALNKFNHPELFENFKFTGLSNFDFFSSDYIDSHL